ncbi:hypothetical protein BDD43_0803 [Mucilaginibacter gracilis]|uniref:DUF6908 domain-containing protein n=1 Tax=Mucilaginibacter gracilis TaxID=423350 RepID=A0A495IWD7_9SPHI|nr:hypothetical protein [Mucilaginibacter gracilis]RKR80671.1 hypothetical protein BDD43_0803 [Mucilaginibacter gracilis]
MKTLNENSAKIFCRLIDKMNGKQHLKIVNEPYMPLTIEQIGEGIGTPWGDGVLYSLCHYYEQNGDLMQDPEMCFVVVDKRGNDSTAWEHVEIVPYRFEQANLAIYQQSVIIKDNRLAKFHRVQQADHAEFANIWLSNIEQQRFI